jgi:hypothetical protein
MHEFNVKFPRFKTCNFSTKKGVFCGWGNQVRGGEKMLSEAAKQAKREYMKKWREKNKEHYNEYSRKWKKENPEKVQKHQANYWERIAKGEA